MTDFRELTEIRAQRPYAVAEAAARRTRRPWPDSRLLIVAADHPARGALAVRDRPLAMASRTDLLQRLQLALSRPGVHGILATPDVLEDLLLLGSLDDRLAIGSMNRGGLYGSAFELDDRFTAYDAATIAAMKLDGGKMLCRIDPADPATARTLEACAHAVSALATRRLMAMVEPLWATDTLATDNVIRSVNVAQALGTSSAYTWLKIPVVENMERVLAATTLPVLLLGGDPVEPPFRAWERALKLPGVVGLVAGRALLYPPDDDVAAAVDAAAALL